VLAAVWAKARSDVSDSGAPKRGRRAIAVDEVEVADPVGFDAGAKASLEVRELFLVHCENIEYQTPSNRDAVCAFDQSEIEVC